jgi:hypothetical protein
LGNVAEAIGLNDEAADSIMKVVLAYLVTAGGFIFAKMKKEQHKRAIAPV